MASQLDSFKDWDRPLRIQRRGNFFSDDGFRDFRGCFENAAQDLLHEFDVSSRNENAFRSYRRLRERQLSGTDRAATIAEENDKFKIVMDVGGFNDADLQVKVSGPNEITVQGRQEKGNGSHSSKKSFRRRFSLPGLADVHDANSILSADNVLTVNIPKKITEVTEQSKQTSSQQKESKQSKFDQKLEESFKKVQDKTSSLFSDTKSSFDDSKWDVKITPRQSFFDDSFFENERQNFQKSVEDVMETRRQKISSFDDLGVFEKVRRTKEDNVQAISVTENTKEHKIVLDVHGFSEGDLKVSAVSECELVVEGRVEKKTEYTSCTQSFKRQFTLAPSAIIRQASSALSSEGILTITVPKKFEPIDFNIPVKTDAATVISKVIQKEQQKENVQNIQTTQAPSKEPAAPQSSHVTESQRLLSQIETVVEKEKNLCQEQEKQGHFVPINLEEQVVKTTQEKTETKYVEPITVQKETQKISSETTTEQRKQEHFVPINLEDQVIKTTKKTTETKYVEPITVQKETQKISSETTTEQEKQEHFVPINLEEQVLQTTQKTTETKYVEPITVQKETKKLSGETTTEQTSSAKPRERQVPVELDTESHVSSSTRTQQQSTFTKTESSNESKPRVEEPQTPLTPQTPITPSPYSFTRRIPITLKGSVYSEAIFDDARKNIEREVEDVLSNYRQTMTAKTDESTTQKQDTTKIETAPIKETAPALNMQTTSTVSEDAHNYKIILDVFGFEEKELKVIFSDARVNEICVEGSSEKCKEGSIAKHSFQRTFQLPESIELDRTSTALSEEGILTITVPKKNQILLLKEKIRQDSKIEEQIKKSNELKKTLVIDQSGIIQHTKPVQTSTAENLDSLSSQTTTSQTTTSSTTQESSADKHQREYIVPLSVDDGSDAVSEADSVSTSNLTSQMSTLSDTSHDVSQDILSSTSSVDTIQSQAKEQGDRIIEVKNMGSNATTEQNLSSFDSETRDIMSRSLFNLPIVSKGHFFDDSFFQDSHSLFESSLRNRMNRFNRSSSFVNDLGFLQSLRQKRITGGNQMVTLSEDEHFNKIVLDVQGFDESALKVKALSENELSIEGEATERSGHSVSKKTFRKSFCLPGKVDLKATTSALSSDGVLSIKIPKKA